MNKAMLEKIEAIKRRMCAKENGIKPYTNGWYFELYDNRYIYRVSNDGSADFAPITKRDRQQDWLGRTFWKKLDLRKPIDYREWEEYGHGI